VLTGSPKDIQAFIRKARMRWPPPYVILARVRDANITGNLAYRKRDRNLLFNALIYYHARRFYIYVTHRAVVSFPYGFVLRSTVSAYSSHHLT
jgi:hypothetical protein